MWNRWPAVVLLAVVATAAKAVAGLIALALVRPWGRVLRRSWLLAVSAAASVLLIVYDGLNVAAGALVLSGVVHPSGSVDRMALRWHVGVTSGLNARPHSTAAMRHAEPTTSGSAAKRADRADSIWDSLAVRPRLRTAPQDDRIA
jgi:hypothetical protein